MNQCFKTAGNCVKYSEIYVKYESQEASIVLSVSDSFVFKAATSR